MFLFFSLFSAINDIEYDGPSTKVIYFKAGQYTVHLYGAEGGKSYCEGNLTKNGGRGAYVKGTMRITGTSDKKIYAFIGGMGKWDSIKGPNAGRFNGGGSGGEDITSDNSEADDASGGGGGATDLRLTTEYDSRVIVAAGGSGAACTCAGAPGG